MKHHIQPPLADVSSPITDEAFRLFVVYDSASANASAAAASELVLHELGEEVAVDKAFCNAIVLDCAEERHAAAQKAAQADMLIVALSSETALQESLHQWMREWQQSRQQDGGLLAVLPQDGVQNSTELVESLREAAISANMDFLCRGANGSRV